MARRDTPRAPARPADRRAVNPRKAAVVIAAVTTTITVIAGLLMTVVDHDNFPTIGTGMWWAVQTVTTVGYGDRRAGDRPRSAPGSGRDAARDRVRDGDHGLDHRRLRRPLGPRAAQRGPCRIRRRRPAGDHRSPRAHRGLADLPELELAARRRTGRAEARRQHLDRRPGRSARDESPTCRRRSSQRAVTGTSARSFATRRRRCRSTAIGPRARVSIPRDHRRRRPGPPPGDRQGDAAGRAASARVRVEGRQGGARDADERVVGDAADRLPGTRPPVRERRDRRAGASGSREALGAECPIRSSASATPATRHRRSAAECGSGRSSRLGSDGQTLSLFEPDRAPRREINRLRRRCSSPTDR